MWATRIGTLRNCTRTDGARCWFGRLEFINGKIIPRLAHSKLVLCTVSFVAMGCGTRALSVAVFVTVCGSLTRSQAVTHSIAPPCLASSETRAGAASARISVVEAAAIQDQSESGTNYAWGENKLSLASTCSLPHPGCTEGGQPFRIPTVVPST